MMLRRLQRWSTLWLMLVALTVAHGAQAQRVEQVLVEPWPGQKVLMVLPLQLGSGWNAGPALGMLVLPTAEQNLLDALNATGKFSVTQPHRFNPLLRRAILENKLTEEQVKTLAENPTLENARGALSKFDFAQTPLIAEFFLEEVRSTSLKNRQSVTLQVTGRLYGLEGPALQNIVLSSDPILKGRTSIDRVLLAGTDAFDQIAVQFVQPVVDFTLPSTDPPPVVEPEPAPEVAPIPLDLAPNLQGQPGGLLPPGTMPQLPPSQPPLGITVPNDPGQSR